MKCSISCGTSYFEVLFYLPEIKKGKLITSHRYDLLPLLRSSPGGIQRELVVYDFPSANIRTFLFSAKLNTVEHERQQVFNFAEFPDFLLSYEQDSHWYSAL